jgi:Ras-related protein Rab-2A
MNYNSKRKIFCVVLLGDSGTGKTQACVSGLDDKSYNREKLAPTVGFEMVCFSNYDDKNPISLNVFDMGGI